MFIFYQIKTKILIANLQYISEQCMWPNLFRCMRLESLGFEYRNNFGEQCCQMTRSEICSKRQTWECSQHKKNTIKNLLEVIILFSKPHSYCLLWKMITIRGKDIAKISTNKLCTLVFDFTSISLHVSTLRQGSLQVILHFKLR